MRKALRQRSEPVYPWSFAVVWLGPTLVAATFGVRMGGNPVGILFAILATAGFAATAGYFYAMKRLTRGSNTPIAQYPWANWPMWLLGVSLSAFLALQLSEYAPATPSMIGTAVCSLFGGYSFAMHRQWKAEASSRKTAEARSAVPVHTGDR